MRCYHVALNVGLMVVNKGYVDKGFSKGVVDTMQLDMGKATERVLVDATILIYGDAIHAVFIAY